MSGWRLTTAQRRAINRLAVLHLKHPANNFGFLPSGIGANSAAACRRMEKSGLVYVTRIAENCFRYGLTEKGKRMASSLFPQLPSNTDHEPSQA